jgi:GT2 family glycosyltransferase
MSSPGLVQIVILNWNGFDLTKDCLLSLARIDYPKYQIIVVDNGSTDGSYEELVSRFPNIEFLRSEVNLGFVGGNNLGLKLALTKYDPDYFLLLNNDTTAEPSFLKNMVAFYSERPNLGIIGGKIYYFDDPKRIWFAGGWFDKLRGNAVHLGENELDIGQYNIPMKINFVTGCCFMMSRKVVDTLGLLDEDFFAYCEDLDYSLRAIEAGFDCYYVPDSVIYHKVSSSFKSGKFAIVGKRSALAYYLNVRNRLYIYRKHKKNINKMGFIFFQIKLTFRYVLGFTLTLQFRNAGSVIRGVWDGISKPVRKF